MQLGLAFTVVYLIWGSTYLAIRIGVQSIPPTLLAGTRFVLAGVVLTGLGIATGGNWPKGRDWLVLLVLSFGLVISGNGLLTWAEQWVPSNQAALIVSTSALYTAFFGTIGHSADRLEMGSAVGLIIGFLGTALMLLSPTTVPVPWLPRAILLVSALIWSASAMFARHTGTKADPIVFSGIEMLVGGCALLSIGFARGAYAHINLTLSGVLAVLYLTIFGSGMAYSTYNWLIHHARPVQLGTIAYVNPAIALILGWFVLGETMSIRALFGVAIMLTGIVLVNRKRRISTAREK